MAEHEAIPQETPPGARIHQLAAPQRYLSSADAGWEGVLAEAFHEPRALEGWITRALPDISLVLFAGGPMRIESRHGHGLWKPRYLRHSDLTLTPDGSSPSELRWQCLTSEPTQTLHLHLRKSLLLRTAEEVAEVDASRVALVGQPTLQDPLLAQIGFALWRELEERSPAGKLYAQTATQMLAVHLLRHYTAKGLVVKEPAQGLTPRQVSRVVDFAQAHLTQDLSLESLAQQTGFSPYHFARLFRRTTGESPHHFVLRLRIERAQCLLQQRDLPLAVVALESGFANQSHFTQVFKRHLGLTPRAYRQDCATGADF